MVVKNLKSKHTYAYRFDDYEILLNFDIFGNNFIQKFPQVQARDVDTTSDIRYSIAYPPESPFWIEPITGKISVRGGAELNSTEDNRFVLTIVVCYFLLTAHFS